MLGWSAQKGRSVRVCFAIARSIILRAQWSATAKNAEVDRRLRGRSGVLYEDLGVHGHLVDVRCSYFLNQRRSYDAMRYIGVIARHLESLTRIWRDNSCYAIRE